MVIPNREGLEINKGARHCKILDSEGEVVFRTTNLRDAEHYLELLDEIDRLHKLLDARGMAPHRIYLLAIDEDKRGRVNLDHAKASEVVIVAKGSDGIVVRHLADGREEIVDLDELEPIEGGSYLQAAEVIDESVQVLVRFDREEESISIAASKTEDPIDDLMKVWVKNEETPGSEYTGSLANSEGDILVYRAEASLEE